MLQPVSAVDLVSLNDRRSIKFIELFRLVAACAVVLTHVNMFGFMFVDKVASWTIAICAATKFSVPTFMVVASFLHEKSYQKLASRPSLASIFRKKWPTLLIPYFAWNVIYILFNSFDGGGRILTGDNLWSLFFGSDHLYFISILIQFFVIYHWFFAGKNSRAVTKRFFICLALTLIFYIISEILLWTRGPDNNFFEWYIGNAIVGWSMFFAWGVMLAKRADILAWVEKHTMALLLLTAMAYTGYFLEVSYEYQTTGAFARLFFLLSGFFYQFLTGNLVLSLCMRFAKHYERTKAFAWLTSLGKNTFGIYLAHMFFIHLWLKVFAAIDVTSPLIMLPVIFTLTIASSALLERGLRKYSPKIGGLLFGAGSQRKAEPSLNVIAVRT